MTTLLLDVDILIKCSCYKILSRIRRPKEAQDGILGVSRFVVRKRLDKDESIVDRSGAKQCFEEYLPSAHVIEPTIEELELAAEIEDTAQRLSLELDTGESQLFAVAVVRGSCLVLTGDKRAIGGAEQAISELGSLSELRGRLVCLEQVVGGVASELGIDETRVLVCGETAVDIALSICFSCSSGPGVKINMTGLDSYINDIRRTAGMLLYEANYFESAPNVEAPHRAQPT